MISSNYKNFTSANAQRLKRWSPTICLAALTFVYLADIDVAVAASAAGDEGQFGFSKVLTRIIDEMKGPWARALSTAAVLIAMIPLFRGLEMSGLMRTLLSLVVILGIILNAAAFIDELQVDGAVVPIELLASLT